MTRIKTDLLADIARKYIGVETLEIRNRDCLDFYNVGVPGITAALDAAYHAGRESLLEAAESLLEARENQMITRVEWNDLRQAVNRARKEDKRGS